MTSTPCAIDRRTAELRRDLEAVPDLGAAHQRCNSSKGGVKMRELIVMEVS